MGVPRPSHSRLLFRFCILLSSQTEEQKWGRPENEATLSDIFAVTMSMVVCMDVETIVNWKIFELKIFHRKKNSWLRVGIVLAEGRCHLNSSGIRLHVRDIAWRSSKEIVAFEATMYTKRYRRQLLEN